MKKYDDIAYSILLWGTTIFYLMGAGGLVFWGIARMWGLI